MSIMSEVKSPEEMAQEIQGKEPLAEEKVMALEDPRLADEYKFSIQWTDPRGKIWKGDFTNRILSFTQISQVGALKARMGGGAPVESLDAYTVDHNEKVSHLTISLIDKPKWAKAIGELKYKDLLDLIYAEVAHHEATFSGRVAPERSGSGGSGDSEGEDEGMVEQEV